MILKHKINIIDVLNIDLYEVYIFQMNIQAYWYFQNRICVQWTLSIMVTLKTGHMDLWETMRCFTDWRLPYNVKYKFDGVVPQRFPQ